MFVTSLFYLPHSSSTDYSYSVSPYSTADYRTPESLNRSDRISAPPPEPVPESVHTASSSPLYSYTLPPTPTAPTYGETTAPPYYVNDPRNDPMQAIPPAMPPNHSTAGTHLTYSSHSPYMVRTEQHQSWSSQSNLLPPSQGPPGYSYRPPHKSVLLQYNGGNVARVDEGRAAGRLGAYDVNPGSDRRTFSSEASPSDRPPNSNFTLPPLL